MVLCPNGLFAGPVRIALIEAGARNAVGYAGLPNGGIFKWLVFAHLPLATGRAPLLLL